MNAQVIGSAVRRLDAPAKAAGAAKYAADYTAPGILHVALVRARLAHAEIVSVDVSEVPEGAFCFTAKDLKKNLLPSIMNDQPALAWEKVRFFGEPIAIVAAGTEEEARRAADKVKVELKALPVVGDPVSALEENAPRVHPKGNQCSAFHSAKGDAEAAFAGCALVMEETFEMPTQSHGFLEPEAAFTQLDGQGRLELISSTQNAFADRDMVASVLGLERDQVVSRAATVGGGFGGKDGNTAQIFPAVVTHLTGCPAKYVFTREEDIRFGPKRHSAQVVVKMGFAQDGRILAYEGRMWLDTGAYGLLGPAVLGLGMEHLPGPYEIENVALDGWLSYTNNTPASAMRGFGAPQGAMATETLINRAAVQLGLDPIEIRKRNAFRPHSRGPMGSRMEHSIGFVEALELFERSDFYRKMRAGEDGVGYGIAAGMMSSGMGKHVPDHATVAIERRADGGYLVRVGLVDIGQGSETVLAMIAAEALGVGVDRIEMRMADTEQTIDSGSTAASRSTYVCGNAIVRAAKRILAGESAATERFEFPEIPGEDGVHSIFGFIVQGVRLKVDPISGAIRLLDVLNVTEAGRVLHPVLMDGQIFGGIAMSTGYALSEQVRYREGQSMETGFANYCMPTAMDAPSMVNQNVPFYEESGPFGAKGVAEASTVALAPAIAAAVEGLAPGLRLSSLPFDREKILEAIQR